jgi:hypothetical protein
MRPSLRAAACVGVLPLLAVTAAACSSYRLAEPQAAVLHPFTPIPTDFARVCVIRTSRLAASQPFPTLDNGVLVGATKGRTFFCYQAEPGEHLLRMQADEPTEEKLYAVGGRSYYLHETIPLSPAVRCEVTWVSDAKASELMRSATYEVVTDTPATERPPAPVPYAKATKQPSPAAAPSP